ncbi:glycosyltransferase family 15 protein [Mycena pura]|uniref:Glycosyltransferase family 15 protein n=1 Tax=Mycena pura TaxID=153505 RepID=A0AAD6VCE2_9AGAR|nr:glycosyltransferase family 15 protein [Mycena pura]
MQRRIRYITLTCIILITLFVLHQKYSTIWMTDDFSPSPSSSHPEEDIMAPPDEDVETFPIPKAPQRANATLVMLARNSDISGALLSVRALEDRFNRHHHYPWVFLNEEEFSEARRRIRVLTPSTVEFGVIPREHWFQPDWVDKEKQQQEMAQMNRQNVKYGVVARRSYHNMCRFNSGFFFQHPLMLKYKWYWRVEPNVKYHCNIIEDPFLFMENNDKIYGFTLAVYEIPATIRSLWTHVHEFMEAHPEYIRETENALKFISNDRGRSYNRCHFWSNFEIASLDFWRGEAYTAFFKHLDATGGFYYERWGDAPVHSIAASLFLKKEQIHLFEEIGYQHDDWSHCPREQTTWEAGRCLCSSGDSFDYSGDSCRRQWDALGIS